MYDVTLRPVAVILLAFAVAGLMLVTYIVAKADVVEACHRNERFFHNGMRYYCVAWPEDPVTVTEETESSA